MRKNKQFWEWVLYEFFQNRCIFCNDVILPLTLCCEKCRGDMAVIKAPICSYCGRNKQDCSCHKQRHAYDAVAAPFYYTGAVQQGLLRLKRYDDPHALSFFAEQMTAVIRREYPQLPFDAIVYVPMHVKAQRKRDYNQSELLAAEVALRTGLPVQPCLVKRYETKPQKALNRTQRLGNVLGVFDVEGRVFGQRLLLIDDVVTTGASAHECAKVLKICGAKSVTVLAVAVTAPKTEEENGCKP